MSLMRRRTEMRRWTERHTFGPDLGRHQSLGARAETNLNELTRLQLGEAEPSQRFHVHKNIGRAFAAGQETKSAQSIEPFDLRAFDTAGGDHLVALARRRRPGALLHIRFVHGDNAMRLQTASA